MSNILLQTIGDASGRWTIGRFSLLTGLLSHLRDRQGRLAFQVRARDRAVRGRPDPLLSRLHESCVDQLWLLATGDDGLTPEDCAGIRRFRRLGGNLMVAPGHMASVRSFGDLGGAEAAYRFDGRNPDRELTAGGLELPRPPADARADHDSGADGGFRRVRSVGNIHPVMRDRHSPTGVIQYLPSHPHEHALSVPCGVATARVIVDGHSAATGQRFNIAVAFERSERGGRAIAQSSVHHFADDNWHPRAGTVSEPAGDGMARFPEALRSTQQYVRNVAFWLSG
ncbi:hypothetical protein [Frateuria sp. STR12]|uniref:hypothetical protein n=1 Tax=Frateuria hangzhouensis TaxID=2995589 RepID=UPI002260F4F1|nr:hypothetical protein [Frateuria sp. STR12]MCX7512263.1 hypothetical protein [Frateuria sp. STR12]